MKNLDASKKNYKFPIGAVFAILAGFAVGINIMLYIIQRTAFSFVIFQQGGFSNLLGSGIYTGLFLIEQFIFMVSLFGLGAALLLKQRKMLLLAIPIAMIFSCFIAISCYMFDMLSMIQPNFVSVLNFAICMFAYVLIALSCLILAVIIISNCRNNKNKLSFLTWISPIPAIFGHLILFINSIIVFSSNLQFFTIYSEHYDDILYPSSVLLGSIRSILHFSFFGILFALTIFFVARWITNPSKKSSQIEESDSEQIPE